MAINAKGYIYIFSIIVVEECCPDGAPLPVGLPPYPAGYEIDTEAGRRIKGRP